MTPVTPSVTVRVPAKVNLRLAVGPAQADGYHELVNVFQAVSLYDEVTVTAARPGQRLAAVTLDGANGEGLSGVPLDRTNLAARAAECLARATGADAAVDIRLSKNIPVAGGMAGGSADAAGALLACDTLWGTGLPEAELSRLAAELGSDVPFALLGGTAVGTGRGERLTPLTCQGVFHWVFALADAGLSTAEVYRTYDRLRPDAPPPKPDPDLERALARGDAEALGRALANDLQPPALALRRELADTLSAGRNAGALGAIVSGSGPTCAFLAADEAHTRRIAAALRDRGACARTVHAYGPVPGAQVLS